MDSPVQRRCQLHSIWYAPRELSLCPCILHRALRPAAQSRPMNPSRLKVCWLTLSRVYPEAPCALLLSIVSLSVPPLRQFVSVQCHSKQMRVGHLYPLTTRACIDISFYLRLLLLLVCASPLLPETCRVNCRPRSNKCDCYAGAVWRQLLNLKQLTTIPKRRAQGTDH